MAPILELKGITKHFPGVLANDHIDLDIEQGEIHALLGENGAGKTTLMNILYGLYQPQEGEIFFQGEKVKIHSPLEAIRLGIGMVHQHFMLIPVFTVTENVVLGSTQEKGIAFKPEEEEPKIKDLCTKLGLDIDPGAVIWQLPVGMQQRVEILKAVYRGAKLLILDEPTAVLTPQETSDLFVILRSLVAHGTSIIFISHKLNEVMTISNRVTVLRNGRLVKTVLTGDTNPNELADMMVGRKVVLQVEREEVECGEPELVLENIWAKNDRGLDALRGVSLSVCKGEILGLAGVDGNGQSEIAELLSGLRNSTVGSIKLEGKEITNGDPSDFIRLGIACIPQDRKRSGSIGDFSLGENMILRVHRQPPFSTRGFMRWDAVYKNADRLIQEFDVRTPSAKVKAKALSGGNLQKMIFGREVSRPHRVLIAVQPTRGLDVAATESVYHYLLNERTKGAAILLISTELDEILTLSDTISVIYEGKIVGEFAAQDARIDQIGLLMAGVELKQ